MNVVKCFFKIFGLIILVVVLLLVVLFLLFLFGLNYIFKDIEKKVVVFLLVNVLKGWLVK